MSAYFADPEKIIGLVMIAAGFVMALLGFIASRRYRRAEDDQEEGNLPDPSRPRMAPLPRLLSTDRSEQKPDAD
ncbi:hypothetical protein [Bradyrhizobium elkanii]|uniref:hypothetical protein n=1 Tax=Bradyrhizobium elkanii TaxID=29448 RepID=UPI0027152B54|nr:hypothetical protein [Bradyrhizobium elkanii]WLA50754.1 hypothetical protein QIH80_11565 [Bradyrhizobium elkanii]WLB79009.1 hypothetical protein QIH83_32455 [Bradyrhizobium elkanii]